MKFRLRCIPLFLALALHTCVDVYAGDTKAERAASQLLILAPVDVDYMEKHASLCSQTLLELRADTLRRAKMMDEFTPKVGGVTDDTAFSAYVVLSNLLEWENQIYYDKCLCGS